MKRLINDPGCAACWTLAGLLGLVLSVLPQPLSAQGWIISGQVVDGFGVGIAGVNLDMEYTATGDTLSLSQDLSDAGGFFSAIVNGLDTGGVPTPAPVGQYLVTLRAPVGSSFFGNEVILPFVGGSTSIGVVPLDLGVFVSGRVVSSTGVGLNDVDLNFTDPLGVEFPASGDFSDLLGNFSVLVPPDTYDILFRPSPLTAGGPFVPVELGDQVATSALDLGDIVLPAGVTLSGTVQQPGGLALANADIDVRYPTTGSKVVTPGDNTDLLGNFSVLVPVGSWLVEIDPPVGVNLVTQVIPFTTLFPPAVNQMGTIVLPAGFPVSGTTVTSTLMPVPDVDLDFIVTATQLDLPVAHDNANQQGTFSVVVPAGTYDIAFRPPFATGLAPLVLPGVTVPTAPLGNVELPAGSALTGTVSDGLNPVVGAQVTLTSTGSGTAVYVFGNRSSAQGTFALRVLPGTYDVTVTAPAGSSLAAAQFPAVNLASDVALTVVLVGSPGQPFIRADANLDGGVNVADAIRVLDHLFGSNPLTCYDSGDSNDDGNLDISDPIYLLGFLFTMGPEPLPPFPLAGPDPTPDTLPCP